MDILFNEEGNHFSPTLVGGNCAPLFCLCKNNNYIYKRFLNQIIFFAIFDENIKTLNPLWDKRFRKSFQADLNRWPLPYHGGKLRNTMRC